MAVQMELRRIVVNELQDGHTLLLKEVDGDRCFSMVVGLFEVRSIDFRVRKEQSPRPLTHDLLNLVIEALGGELQDILISEMREQTYFARVRIRKDGEIIEVDSRPSDAIALAVTAQVPIYASEDVIEEASTNIEAMKSNPREFIRDPVLLEFLGLPSPCKIRENVLEQALIEHLQGFLLELGKGFSFVARQQRISTDGVDLYIDLVFYNYLLKCFVIIDLKRGKLSARDVGQMDMYVRMYDELMRSEGDKPTVGIILSAESNDSVARYSMLKGNEQLFASSYKTILPSEEELRAELNREQALIEERRLTQSTE